MITVGRHFLDCHHVPGAIAMPYEELPDPATLAEELLLAIEVWHDNSSSAHLMIDPMVEAS